MVACQGQVGAGTSQENEYWRAEMSDPAGEDQGPVAWARSVESKTVAEFEKKSRVWSSAMMTITSPRSISTLESRAVPVSAIWPLLGGRRRGRSQDMYIHETDCRVKRNLLYVYA